MSGDNPKYDSFRNIACVLCNETQIFPIGRDRTWWEDGCQFSDRQGHLGAEVHRRSIAKIAIWVCEQKLDRHVQLTRVDLKFSARNFEFNIFQGAQI